MTYQVFAQKWRPKNLKDVIGQDLTVKAIAQSLQSGQISPAYLLTGTRGVGKTTLGRIIAKTINCKKYPTDEPCNVCESCQAFNSQSHPDLHEIDAASKTKVEDTRTLLEHIQYTPIMSHFKVYLIDEVHMLSNHSFNALLKTLEEPPKHVLFLLATTDPQKIPATIISRCIHYSLSAITNEQIQGMLCKVLDEKNHTYEAGALNSIAHAAYGSMRDALTMLEQACSLYPSNLQESDINNWLGQISSKQLDPLIKAICDQDQQTIIDILKSVRLQQTQPKTLLEQLAKKWHQKCLDAAINKTGECDYYLNQFEIITHGFKQLSQVSYPWLVVEMTLLRSAFSCPLNSEKNHEIAKESNETTLIEKIAQHPSRGLLKQALSHLNMPERLTAPYRMTYSVQHDSFYTDAIKKKIKDVLAELLECTQSQITLQQSDEPGASVYEHKQTHDKEQRSEAMKNLNKDPLVKDLMNALATEVDQGDLHLHEK